MGERSMYSIQGVCLSQAAVLPSEVYAHVAAMPPVPIPVGTGM